MTNEMKSAQSLIDAARWEVEIDGRLLPETYATEDEANAAGAAARGQQNQSIKITVRQRPVPVVVVP